MKVQQKIQTMSQQLKKKKITQKCIKIQKLTQNQQL